MCDSGTVTVLHSDNLVAMAAMPDCSVDAVVTDPPAGISFMSKAWDHDHGGRDKWIAWLTEIMAEAYRLLKPGAHALVWALPRTSHWTATAVEDAGFEVRDVITHHFGSGFPKSRAIGKAIDQEAGAEREVVGQRDTLTGQDKGRNTFMASPCLMDVTAPATPAARQWEGWGTALKPATENWILARKPLSEPTIAANVLRWGTGAVNVAACRISCDWATDPTKRGWQGRKAPDKGMFSDGHNIRAEHSQPNNAGRWPANLVLSHADGCEQVGVKRVKGSNGGYNWNSSNNDNPTHITHNIKSGQHYADADGLETVAEWHCVEGCPVKALDEQSGVSRTGNINGTYNNTIMANRPGERDGKPIHLEYKGDTGGASRFFPVFPAEDSVGFRYCAKANRAERDAGLEGMPLQDAFCWRDDVPNGRSSKKPQGRNDHPTVKPVALMRWLVRLVTPPGGLVLDPFGGSGTTAVACIREGFGCILIEQDEHNCDIARARIGAEPPLLGANSLTTYTIM